MDFTTACQQLADWLDTSLGQRIVLPSGDSKGFRLTQDYTPDELAAFEADFQIALPPDYRAFLLQVGAGEVFYGGTGPCKGLSFSRLDALEELYHEYFDKQADLLLKRYLPVGCDYARQLIGLFDLQAPSTANFALVPDELNSSDWPAWIAEHQAATTFSAWIIQMVATEGEFPADGT